MWDETDDVCSILVPADITNTPGAIVSIWSNGAELAEDPAPEWNAGQTYAAGARVRMTSTHRVYESVKDNNVGKNPSAPANQYSASGVATWWIEIGPTNRHAMFDSLISTQTSAPSPLAIALTPGAFSGFAVFGVDADSYTVTVKDAPHGNIIYSEYSVPLDATAPSDYYEYFFERFKPLRQFIRTGLVPYGNSIIEITFYRATGDVKLGMLALGDLKPIGIPQRDARVEPQDFSYLKQDAFGNTSVKKRANATSMSISCMMDITEAGPVLDTIKEILGVPVVVVASQAKSYEWLTAFGLVSGSMTPVPFPMATLNISVKGLI